MIAALLLAAPALVAAPDPAPGPQPQIAWACEMTAPDKKAFQLAGTITGGVLPPGETNLSRLTRRVATVTTDTSGRLTGTARQPYLFASWQGEGYFSFSMPAKTERYQATLQLFQNGRPGFAYLTHGYPHAKEALGIGYCTSKWQDAATPQPETKTP
jgi:hypothetical protein